MILSGGIALALLSAFCFLYNYTGVHIDNRDGGTDYKWESNHYYSTMTEGYSWIFYDKNGFNNLNDEDFNLHPVDILLMGSSHMDAYNIGKNENLGALLNIMLPNYRTYNIGMSGHEIYNCVQNLKKTVDYFNPT